MIPHPYVTRFVLKLLDLQALRHSKVELALPPIPNRRISSQSVYTKDSSGSCALFHLITWAALPHHVHPSNHDTLHAGPLECHKRVDEHHRGGTSHQDDLCRRCRRCLDFLFILSPPPRLGPPRRAISRSSTCSSPPIVVARRRLARHQRRDGRCATSS